MVPWKAIVGAMGLASVVGVVACSSSSSDGGGATTDGGTTPIKDAGPSTPPADSGSALACEPRPDTGEKPKDWGPPQALHQNVCTAAAVDAFFDACIGASSTSANCLAWLAADANKTCGACLATSRDAAKSGATFIDATGQYDDLNVGGCVDTFEPGCGRKFVDWTFCRLYSCDSSPSGNCAEATDSEVGACWNDADVTTCNALTKSYVAACGKALDPLNADQSTTPPALVCLPLDKETNEGWIKRTGLLFCGPKT